tara:strand:- start:86 stop:937 length:852 start_codon:yes stop_codon:yes gene_type:complete
VTKQLTKRAEELRLLGWSDDGASRYASINEDARFDLQFTDAQVIAIILGLLFLLLLISVIIFSINLSRNRELKDLPSQIAKVDMTELLGIELEDSKIDYSKKNKDLGKDKLPDLFKEKFESLIFIDDLLGLFSDNSVDIDIIIINLIAIFWISFDYLMNFIELIKPNSDFSLTPSKAIINTDKYKNKLNKRSDKELKSLLDGISLIENIDRDSLIKIIASTPIAVKRLNLEERKLSLQSKTNQELRSLLDGVEKISRLKKSELINKVLSIEEAGSFKEKNIES